MRTDMRKGLLLGTALLGGAMAVLPVGGSMAAAAASVSDSGIEEVVVTAQKRSENLQEVPSTVSVLSNAQIQQMHVTQLADISAYVPGLQVGSAGTPGQTTLTIRGIAPLSSNATVATYVDETPIGATAFHNRGGIYSLDLLPYDVQQIEVLAGPQGTLYGANALGGLIKYELVKPSLDGLSIKAGGDVFAIAHASDPGGGVRASINAALVPGQLGLIASYGLEHTPGYIDNAATGEKDQNPYTQQSGRLALLWQANADFSVQLGGLYQKTSADGNATVALDPATGRPVAGDLEDNNLRPNTYHSSLIHVSADVNWDLHWAQLVSATSWSRKKDTVVQDATDTYQALMPLLGAPADSRIDFPIALSNKKFTEELRLSSPSDQTIEWLVGAFYDNEDSSNIQYLRTYDSSNHSLASLGVDPLFVAGLPGTYKEYAGFANVTIHFTDWFDIGGGVRYAHNEQTFEQIVEPGSPILPPSNVPGKSSEGVWTWSVKPRLHLSKTVMAYAHISTGYQAGGPNTALPGVPPSVNSSTLTNYEVGIKSSFWGDRAIVNASVYELDWENIQVPASAPGGISYVTNGGTARSRGFEVDTTLNPVDGLQLHGTVTYTEAELTQDVPSIGAMSGARLPYVPLWAGSLRADYTRPAWGDWTWRVGAGLRLVDTSYNPDPFTLDGIKLSGYGALDLDADLSNGRYTIRLFAKNLTDKRAYISAFGYPDLTDTYNVQNEATVLQPRTIGLSFDVNL